MLEVSRSPLVSVVIPTRNRLSLLRRAIASVDAQDYPNVEIVVVDNFAAMPLRPEDVLSRFPLRIVRTDKLLPLPASRNFGAERASGEFLCFLDDDDEYLPSKLGDQAPVLIADPSLDYVYGDTRQVGPGGETIVVSSGPTDIRTFLRWRYVHTNALMIRKAAFRALRYNEEMTTYEDVEFTARLMRACKGRHIPKVHAIWRRDNRPDQLTRKNWPRNYANWKRLCTYNHAEIVADRDLRRFYHGKMLALALMQGDVPQAWRSALIALK